MSRKKHRRKSGSAPNADSRLQGNGGAHESGKQPHPKSSVQARRKREAVSGAGGTSAGTAGVSKAVYTSWLERASVAYIALPVCIFLLGFFRLAWALPAVAALLAAAWFYFRHANAGADGFISRNDIIPQSPPMPWLNIALCFAAALTVTALFGAGGWGHQSLDWQTNNALLTHHTNAPWPVMVENEGKQAFIVYYLSYYMPAILTGKLFGFLAANQVLFVWTLLGVFLSLLWVFVFSRTAALWIVAVFLFFSGMDIIGLLLFPDESLLNYLLYEFQHLEWWTYQSDHHQLAANITQIAWLPRHVLPAWLLTSLLLKNTAAGNAPRNAAFVIGLGVSWSALAPVGIALLFAAHQLVRPLKELPPLLRRALSPENLLVLPSVVCTAMFFFANTSATDTVLGVNIPKSMPLFLAFFALEFALLWAVVFTAGRRRGKSALWGNTFGRLFVLTPILLFPLLWLGNVDLQKNAAIPLLFILMLACIRLLEGAKMARAKKFAAAVLVLLAIGAATPLMEIRRALGEIINRGALYEEVQPRSIFNLPMDWHEHIATGDVNSVYYKHFAPRHAE